MAGSPYRIVQVLVSHSTRTSFDSIWRPARATLIPHRNGTTSGLGTGSGARSVEVPSCYGNHRPINGSAILCKTEAGSSGRHSDFFGVNCLQSYPEAKLMAAFPTCSIDDAHQCLLQARDMLARTRQMCSRAQESIEETLL